MKVCFFLHKQKDISPSIKRFFEDIDIFPIEATGSEYESALGIIEFLRDKSYDLIVFCNCLFCKQLAGFVAGNLGCGISTDCSLKINNKKIYTEKIQETEVLDIEFLSKDKVATLLAEKKYNNKINTLKLKTLPKVLHDSVKLISLKEQLAQEEKKIAIGVGRGVKPQDFGLIEKFANLIDAGIVCSRPFLTTGILKEDTLVGQSGKSIEVEVYIPIGISGALQHMCAVRCKKLIAINKDKSAQISKAADIFIPKDYKEVLENFLKDA